MPAALAAADNDFPSFRSDISFLTSRSVFTCATSSTRPSGEYQGPADADDDPSGVVVGTPQK
jgi:hypothetical protein